MFWSSMWLGLFMHKKENCKSLETSQNIRETKIEEERRGQ